MNDFTDLDLKKYAAFERVRAGGKFNMFDPRAQKASKLTRDDFLFVMHNYSALREAATPPKDSQ